MYVPGVDPDFSFGGGYTVHKTAFETYFLNEVESTIRNHKMQNNGKGETVNFVTL